MEMSSTKPTERRKIDDVQDVLTLLSDVTTEGEKQDQWNACCPAHEDRTASLSIAVSQGGEILLHCHAGCSKASILQSLDLRFSDLFPNSNGHKANGHAKPKLKKDFGKIVATYDYRDEQGELLFQVVRFEPKDFRQRRRTDKGSWTWQVKGVRKVPYRLPEIIEADPARPVFIVEGEKDADLLTSGKLVATTAPGGAGTTKRKKRLASSSKWLPSFSAHLTGRFVVIIPDNDDVGRSHAELIAKSLHGIAKEVRILNLPDLPAKGDLSDWVAASEDNTPSKLLQIAETVQAWEPSTGDVIQADDVAIDDPDALADAILETGRVLRYWRGQHFGYDGRKYQCLLEKELTATIREAIRPILRERFDSQCVDEDRKPPKITRRMTSDTLHAIEGKCLLPGNIRPPTWIGGSEPRPDAINLISTPAGILDITRPDKPLIPPTADLFTLTAVEYNIDRTADCPLRIQTLSEIFCDDLTQVDLVQEWFGLNLSLDTSFERIALLSGESRGGKSTIVDTLESLVGKDAFASIQPGEFAGPFGLESLVGKSSVVIADMRAEREHRSTLLGRLLSISGNDSLTINRKYQSAAEERLRCRITITTNQPPDLNDSTDALCRRLLPIRFTQRFTAENGRDNTRKARLKNELPGIFNWALVGYARLRKQGGFSRTRSGEALLRIVEQANAPVRVFVEDCCELGKEYLIRKSDLYNAYCEWAKAASVTREADNHFAAKLRDAFPSIEVSRPRQNGERVHCYIGIRMKTEDELDGQGQLLPDADPISPELQEWAYGRRGQGQSGRGQGPVQGDRTLKSGDFNGLR